MARPKKLKPDYCLDKTSSRAYVTIDGKRNYLGKHGTQESRDKYDRVVGQWMAAGRTLVTDKTDAAPGRTVSAIIAAFWTHAESYYAACILHGGKIAGELDNYR